MPLAGWRRDAGSVKRDRQQEKEILMDTVHDSLRREGLVRPRDGRILGGVCAGLGRRFGIDPWPARLLFVLILFVIPGSQILIYPILWILMPSEVAPTSVRYGVGEVRE
jgi:phage shock protein PspC (stress-responsive transcriptional regulator)